MSFDEKLDDIKNYINKKNAKALQAMGHKLHGSGASYGFNNISLFGKVINQLAHEEDWIKLEEQFNKLNDYITNQKSDFEL